MFLRFSLSLLRSVYGLARGEVGKNKASRRTWQWGDFCLETAWEIRALAGSLLILLPGHAPQEPHLLPQDLEEPWLAGALLASSSCLALREEMENAGCGTALRVTSFFSQAPFCRELLETTGAAVRVGWCDDAQCTGAGADCSQSWCTSVTRDSRICLGKDRCQVLSFRQGPHSHQPLAGI